MRITVAKTAGFCMGVRRAVEMVLDAPENYPQPIYTYGPLIHNPQVLELLEEKSIRILHEIPDSGSGTVLIRAHGVPHEASARLEAAGFKVVNATCPRVIRVQTIIRKHAAKGYPTIIIGDKDHPEVVGLLGYAGSQGEVVSTLEAFSALPTYDAAIVVAQTTQNRNLYDQIRQWTAQHYSHYKVFETICNSTDKRQAEVLEMAQEADAIVVVGGKESGNTRRLAEIAEKAGTRAFHVETDAELNPTAFAGLHHVAITAGASTPNWMISRVYRTLEKIPLRKGPSINRLFYVLRRGLLLTNTYVALGAGALCYACIQLQRLQMTKPLASVMVAVLYVFSMHTLNNLIRTQSDRYNDPGRAYFYHRYRIPLLLLAIIAGGWGLIIASQFGKVPFIILLTMSLMGLGYDLRVLPENGLWGRYSRLRDIPGAKTILITLAWGVVAVLLPAVSASGPIKIGSYFVFVWCMILVFSRTAFFDTLDMQGDRMVGKETIPLVFGHQKTRVFLQWILLFVIPLMMFAVVLDIIPGLGVALTICPLILLWILHLYAQNAITSTIRIEFWVETQFIFAGFLSYLWSLWY